NLSNVNNRGVELPSALASGQTWSIALVGCRPTIGTTSAQRQDLAGYRQSLARRSPRVQCQQ
ncbi:MAG: hypothetical protein K0U93_18440, partial [Gammaproteobacteria bacterium]|nr:hypothetical protein [Gammaproteobacteria bacterium]